jgi:predicted CopG family antitoxin
MSKQVTDTKLVKTLKITDETHARLAKLGSVGQTFEDVIRSLLDEHDEKANAKK